MGISAKADELRGAVATLKKALHEMEETEEGAPRAHAARVLRLETMAKVRAICDDAEEVIPASMWTLGTYKELLFLDSHYGAKSLNGAMGAASIN